MAAPPTVPPRTASGLFRKAVEAVRGQDADVPSRHLMPAVSVTERSRSGPEPGLGKVLHPEGPVGPL